MTNTGDTTLFDISIDDDTLGHVGDIPSLAAGQTAERTFEITLGSSPITNVATASGTDVLGGAVSDVDDATVTVVAGGGDEDGDGTGGGGGSPFTGSGTGRLAGWIGLLVALGSTLIVASRKRPEGRPEGSTSRADRPPRAAGPLRDLLLLIFPRFCLAQSGHFLHNRSPPNGLHFGPDGCRAIRPMVSPG